MTVDNLANEEATITDLVDDVLVKVHAAALNPIDYKVIHGTLRAVMPLQFPAPLAGLAGAERTPGSVAVLAVMLGSVLFAGLLVVLSNLAVDLLYAVLDPRVRVGGTR